MIVHLHIGTPKSGTSYLQQICSLNREVLAVQGILWPGEEWGDQVLAVRDVLNFHPGGEFSEDATGAWAWFVNEVDEWSGRGVLLSMEWLVHASPAQAEFIVESLRGHEVRVLITARDLARSVPAQWQEQTQNWATWTWEEYLRAVTSDQPWEHEAGRQFWLDHDLGRILRTWSVVVPAERITLITVPGRDAAPDLLWRRFAEAVSIAPGAVDTDVPPSNASLGAASAELMRRLNVATRESGLSWRVVDPILKWALAKAVLVERRGREPRLALSPEHHDWAVRESRRLVDEVASLGIPVIGSLAELMPEPPLAVGSVAVTTAQILEAAIDGIAGLVTLVGAAVAGGSMGPEALQAGTYVAAVERRQALGTAAADLDGIVLAPERGGARVALHPGRATGRLRVGLRWAAARARTAAARLRSRDRGADIAVGCQRLNVSAARDR